jgi:hypothetical protein
LWIETVAAHSVPRPFLASNVSQSAFREKSPSKTRLLHSFFFFPRLRFTVICGLEGGDLARRERSLVAILGLRSEAWGCSGNPVFVTRRRSIRGYHLSYLGGASAPDSRLPST